MIHRFCISHTKPLLPEHWYDDCIALGGYRPDSALHVRQLDQFWHQARPLAYGAAGSYVVPLAIQRLAGDVELVEISSYRKRTLPAPEGRESHVYPTMRELCLEDFDKVGELAQVAPAPGLEFLLAQPLYIRNTILGNYATVHHRQDILDYASLAAEIGVLNSRSAADFLAAKHFIPGGIELGIYPKSWLVENLSKVEIVGRHFLTRFGRRLEKYNRFQIRAVGFLGERLGSFLLLRHLDQTFSRNIPVEVFGHATVMVGGDSKYTAGLADRPKGRSGSPGSRSGRVE